MKAVSDTRYINFTYLDESQEFCELFKNQNYDIVQVHDMTPVGNSIVGFAGCFKWQDNKIVSLDGDSYTKHMSVLGYKEFDNVGLKCLEILSDNW